MSRVKVLMTASHGANFAGEKVFFDQDRALQLVDRKVCVLLDENDNPILPTAGVVEESNGGDGENANGNQNAGGGQADGKKPGGKKKRNGNANPFAIDGFGEAVIAALAAASITSPEELIAYAGGGKAVSEIAGIDAATAEQLTETYLKPE